MSLSKKKTAKKTFKKRGSSTVVVIHTHIAAEDTLFPEKVASAKKVLRNANFHDSRFGIGLKD